MNKQKLTLGIKSIVIFWVTITLVGGQFTKDSEKKAESEEFNKSNFAYHMNPEVNEILEDVTGLDFFVENDKVIVKELKELKEYTEYSAKEYNNMLIENYYSKESEGFNASRYAPSYYANNGEKYDSVFFIKDNVYLTLGHNKYLEQFVLLDVKSLNFEISKYNIEKNEEMVKTKYTSKLDIFKVYKKDNSYQMNYEISQLKVASSFYMSLMLNSMTIEINKILTFLMGILFFICYLIFGYGNNGKISTRKLSFRHIRVDLFNRKKRKENKLLYLKKEKELRKKNKEKFVAKAEKIKEEKLTIKND